ncbi:hypothetical protein FA95DRAFT_1668582, partial [Auriscalpium vulgare]
MLAAAKTHHVNFSALKLAPDLKKQLPAWFHIGTAKARPIADKAKCLMNNHGIKRTKDLMKVTRRLTERVNGRNHYARSNCACNDCRTDKANACKNPHRCALEAQAMLGQMDEKTNPTRPEPKDGLSFTHRRREKHRKAIENKDEVTFDPSVTTEKLADAFRVF